MYTVRFPWHFMYSVHLTSLYNICQTEFDILQTLHSCYGQIEDVHVDF